ncbi:MAG: RluA family pseudouridine synthase [Bdellovibrionia bacterium]
MSLTLQRGFEYGVLHLYSPRSGPLLSVLEELNFVSEYSAHFLISFGCVYVKNQRVIREDFALDSGDYLRLHTRPRRFPMPLLPLAEVRVFENENFLVINKQPAVPCHPTVDNLHENVLSFYSQELGQPLFLTHRLDVPTSGLLLLAKTKEYQSEFNNLLKARKVRKIYQAQAHGVVKEQGLWRHYMKPSPRAPKEVFLQAQEQDYQLCELLAKVLEIQEQKSLLEIELLTGRTHQIRAQSQAMGHPLIGDTLYGAPKFYDQDQIALKAVELRFEDPTALQEYHFKLPGL